MYAIVDIETTGGNAAQGGITEIAIVLHNGNAVEGRFETLVNPHQFIPRYITALTGIDNAMVATAPSFAEVAPQICNLLQNRVFVAHNVNFDHSFVTTALQDAGFQLQVKKLCTVRYARKVWPGKPSYSLGKLCEQVGIGNEARHRAGGDADATTQLLEKLLADDEGLAHLQTFLKGRNVNSYLPMHVPSTDIEDLPYCPGVYYFHNQAGKVVYVGKARNLKYRVRSHFANNNTNQRKQEFIRNIHRITYKVCATELMALVLEAIEIKRLWPIYNRSQKRFEQLYCLYAVHDQQGMMRWAIEKKRKHLPALYAFHGLATGYALCRKLADLFDLSHTAIFAGAAKPDGEQEPADKHNFKMKAATNHLQQHLPHFGIVQLGTDEKGNPVYVGFLVRGGKFVGMGYVNDDDCASPETFGRAMEPQPDYDFVRTALFNHAERYPTEVLQWPAPAEDRLLRLVNPEEATEL